MPNWCANRIRITVPACLQADLEAWVSGAEYPYYKRAINQSIRLFIAGVAGRLKPAIEMHYLPYPALTANGWTEPSEAALAFGAWVALLGQNAWLDKACCNVIDQCYRTTGIAGLTWDALTVAEQARVEEMMRGKTLDWGHCILRTVSCAELFDSPEAEPEGETFDLRLIFPTRLACEINGFNGGLLQGVQSTFDWYLTNYGIRWPSASGAEITGGHGWLEIDVDTPWAPPGEPVMEALSGRWGCTIDHWFSEAGSDFCGYRRYEEGCVVDCLDDCLEYGEEDEYGWSDVTGPDWLQGNVPHYGG
ncbi:DUF1281 domain-containing protein [Scandinavium lactucae]|uniref:DUF1281 domain-containing protein n=1 Tax=Scandinavium lactucae TaxID=3095028 RepID=A0ABU4QQZ4_9ENTR|nr:MULTISPECIES: DUF1281 domain-containing protein [unclassified Scandinavium]MDX6041207.1 DUF1281 domain-containing protein [Scandinavium sp. V105_6]MDX6049725.1 DUF1281 domain-containing protein [Scandinavium sp. V105_1]